MKSTCFWRPEVCISILFQEKDVIALLCSKCLVSELEFDNLFYFKIKIARPFSYAVETVQDNQANLLSFRCSPC